MSQGKDHDLMSWTDTCMSTVILRSLALYTPLLLIFDELVTDIQMWSVYQS